MRQNYNKWAAYFMSKPLYMSVKRARKHARRIRTQFAYTARCPFMLNEPNKRKFIYFVLTADNTKNVLIYKKKITIVFIKYFFNIM